MTMPERPAGRPTLALVTSVAAHEVNPMEEDRLTIADLIWEHQDKTLESYATIAKRAGMSKARIGQLARDVGFPRITTLEKLAIGLELPLAVVKEAAMATAGVYDPVEAKADDEDTARMREQLEALSPEDRHSVGAFIGFLFSTQPGNVPNQRTPDQRSLFPKAAPTRTTASPDATYPVTVRHEDPKQR